MRHTKYDIQNTNCQSQPTSPRSCFRNPQSTGCLAADAFWQKARGGGFTIAELLLALAIASILLAAVAVAINGSIINYRQNEDMFKVINSARQALFRITTQLRTADAVDPDSPANECTLITSNGDAITYRYNNGDNKLYLITNDDLSDPDYVLCDNVTAMTFTKALTDDLTDCKSVQISITVARGNVQRKISAAAVVRRNLSW